MTNINIRMENAINLMISLEIYFEFVAAIVVFLVVVYVSMSEIYGFVQAHTNY